MSGYPHSPFTTQRPQRWASYCPHFTDEEDEVQDLAPGRSEVQWRRSQAHASSPSPEPSRQPRFGVSVSLTECWVRLGVRLMGPQVGCRKPAGQAGGGIAEGSGD